jgi:hypothetical protein
MSGLLLGTRDASAILEPAYAPKVGDPAPVGRRVAIIVNHGMGQQVPYETIDDVAQAVWRGVGEPQSGVTSPRSLIRRVRLGMQGKDEVENELVRAEIQIQREEETYDVHIYESYWAPLTEGKVTLKDVMTFLFDAGLNGFENTEAKKGFQRWMFGREESFELPKTRLILTLGALMLLLLALVFMNAVLAAAAASHAIGAGKTFPDATLAVPLTSDFIVADLAAALIALGTVILPWLYKKAAKSASIPRWLAWLGWILVAVGAFLIVLAGFCMLLQLAGFYPEHYLWPRVLAWTQLLADGNLWPEILKRSLSKVLMTGLWGIELAAAYAIRWCLIEYVGDVTAYIAAHTVSKFYDLRQQIWATAMKVARVVYRAEAHHKAGAEAHEFLYEKIIVVGHSLGSVIGYDVLNGLLLEDELSDRPLRVADRTPMFLTFGSPLDKTAFLFRTQSDMCSPVREVAAAAVQPMIQDYRYRPYEWVNLYSGSDIISGHLDFYDPPDKTNAQDKLPFRNAATAPVVHPRAVRNLVDPDARTPLAAHVEYWNGKLFAEELVRAITTQVP